MASVGNCPLCKSEVTVFNVQGTMVAGLWCISCDTKWVYAGKPSKMIKDCQKI